jgi:hypothetical protein
MAQNLGKSILTLGVDGSQMTAGMKKAQGDMAKTGKSAKDLNTNLRFMRGGMGQVGHQIQDVAVQLQGGTDAMIVFGQQGSQIASLFGPGGALLGALLAVGAAAAGPLYDSFTDTSDAIADLGEKAAEFNAITKDTIPLLREIEQAGIDKKYKEIQEEIDGLNAKSKRYQDEIDGINNGTIAAIATDSKREKQLARLQRFIDENAASIATMEAEQRELTATNDEEVLSLRDSTTALRESVETYGMNIVEMAVYKAAKDGVITELERETIALSGSMLALELETEAMKEAAKEAEKLANAREKAEQKKAKEDVAAGAAATSLFNQLLTETEQIQVELERRQQIIDDAVTAGQYNEEQAQALRTMIAADAAAKRTKIAEDEASANAKLRKSALQGLGDQLMALDANNKKVFKLQKAYRIAQAIMDAHAAYGNALAAPYPPPIPQIMAGAAIALGMANVAQIKAQSFEGGGFTGYGARAGGLDGKGGRMAMVHPNETVVDHRKGGAAGITIVNNVDARGAGADVDQKIKSAMAQTSQQTIMTIQDLKRRGRF